MTAWMPSRWAEKATGVVARRSRDDALRAVLLRELAEAVERAPQLERSRHLKIFRLQIDGVAADGRKIRALNEPGLDGDVVQIKRRAVYIGNRSPLHDCLDGIHGLVCHKAASFLSYNIMPRKSRAEKPRPGARPFFANSITQQKEDFQRRREFSRPRRMDFSRPMRETVDKARFRYIIMAIIFRYIFYKTVLIG